MRNVCRQGVVAEGFVKLGVGVGNRELGGGRHLAIEDIGHGIATFFTGIPGLDDGCTLLCETRDDLSTATEDYQYYGIAGLNEFFHILFLFARQTETLTVAVLTTEHDVLTHSGDDDIGVFCQSEGLVHVGILTGINLTMQDFILPGTLVAEFTELGFNLLCPVAATGVHEVHALRCLGFHTL